MLANNETGVIQDVAAVAARARAAKAWMHTDAVQALGKIPVDFAGAGRARDDALGAQDLRPEGRRRRWSWTSACELRPLIHGGGHEQGLRSGTENVPAIVGFGAACELAAGRMQELAPRLAAMRDAAGAGPARDGGGDFRRATRRAYPTPATSRSRASTGETLVIELDKAGYAVAPGAACSSANPEPSATLLAMGVDAGAGARRGAFFARRGEYAAAGGRFSEGAEGGGVRA